ncbi:hypothetical protein QQS21_001783 [Conoideocrella luteorostrata]|uniref:Zn(2)-C6 fungal-type domain-containing protein n=1 Tax=Conoideocrella luteorostrata TaxID=1105319 RepID=A0AAJ0FX62_9HYPO|nr:hypothetical protein QQS21_001783 [Conoideocrella luteorostrata]
MPGVPSYRGCEACRRQKKKCDQAKPSCSRCSRLDIACIGVGKQRFKFKDHSAAFIVVDKRVTRRPTISLTSRKGDPPRAPSSNISITVGMLVSVLEVTDPGYDVFSFGSFIKEIPKRIGHNPALDAAASAFASAVKGARSKQRSVESLRKYAISLQAVQNTINDPEKTYSAETLCAIYLIMVCHDWVVSKYDKYPNHGEALSHLLKIMVDREPQDPFAIQVMVTAGIAVILENVFNPAINVQPWIHKLADLSQSSAANKRADASPGINFNCLEVDKLGSIPELIYKPWENIDRIQSLYESIWSVYPGIKHFGETVIVPACVGPLSLLPLKLTRALTCFHAAQCLMISIGIAMNGFLRCVNPTDQPLADECYELCTDAISLAERAKVQRPLAAGHIAMLIVVALLSSNDDDQQATLRRLMCEYEDDYAMMN